MWKSIIAVELETFWKYTPNIEGTFFRLRHINPPKTPIGWIGQAESIPNTKFLQVFGIQRINGLSNYEIIELPKPIVFETRRLVFRQETKIPNNWIIEVEVANMPSYPLENTPTLNSVAATTKNVTTVAVAATPTLLLAANSLRKNVKFYSADKLKTVYIDTDKVVSNVSAVDKIDPNSVCIPAISWNGEWWGISTSGTVNIEVEEYL